MKFLALTAHQFTFIILYVDGSRMLRQIVMVMWSSFNQTNACSLVVDCVIAAVRWQSYDKIVSSISNISICFKSVALTWWQISALCIACVIIWCHRSIGCCCYRNIIDAFAAASVAVVACVVTLSFYILLACVMCVCVSILSRHTWNSSPFGFDEGEWDHTQQNKRNHTLTAYNKTTTKLIK